MIEKLRQLDTTCLCDAEKALNLGLRVMSPDLRPIRYGLKLVGRAHTVKCHDDFLTVIKALRDAEAGVSGRGSPSERRRAETERPSLHRRDL
jgi:regulator of RNase E activity RraA